MSDSTTPEFEGKTALITGAGTGIGRAVAIGFAKAGANVILIGRNRETLASTAKEVQSIGGHAEIFPMDLTNENDVAAFFSKLSNLDYAVNNAGTEGRIAEISEISMADYDDAMTINVRALFQCVSEEVKYFRKNKKPGAIVNLSSVAGIVGIPTSSLYVASKHAVIGLTKAVALEQIRNGIRVNAVCPGGVATPMMERIFHEGLDQVGKSYPIGRMAEPEEIAQSILWLCSEKSSYVVGHAMLVDGGRTAE
jgi:NAD(P)-dependent dehydrogenase (short-subunit alcohol dehydrogenase family)